MARMLGPILPVILALSPPGRAQQPPASDADICIAVHLARGHWRRLSDDRLEVETGAKMRFPPDGMVLKGGTTLPAGDGDGIGVVCLPRARLDEIRRIVEEEIPPHRWSRLPDEWIIFGPSTKF